ncbi:MAG: AAA family ATPase [Thermoleophilia bacterium]|nr:AAA family ATPase [Thermoleophilia bacterium]
MRELPSGTVTFLFTDVEGSTRLLREHGERYAELLSEHRRLLREAFGRHGGVEVDTQGDAFFYAFSRASDALAAAEDGRRALEQTPVRVRVGVHTGEPTVTAEGYVGIDVHAAARIAASAHGGQILVSARTRSLLGEDDGLRDLGLHRLKDLGEPQKLYQLGDGEFPPPKTLDATNLPAQPSALVGRGRELGELKALVRSGARLVTVSGAGGTGKTRLALQAAAELVDDFPDGVFWVSLQAVTDPELVRPMVASTVGARGDLRQHLDEKRVLLLLDNLEQLLPSAAAPLADLLAVCPNVVLLVTSRALVRVTAEVEYPLEPLPLADAVTLFRERAPHAEPGDAVAEICRRLDGLPLAVELAAARTRVLPPEQLLRRLRQALPLLTGGARDAPERQRTLEATIAWSYELLDAGEQRLFRRLSVFAGAFDAEAAEQVARADLDTLESLVEKSLLRRWASGRLGMLATIREFAAGRLGEAGERDEVARRHARHFCALAESANLFVEAEGEQRHDLALAEQDNLRAALDWASAHDVELGLRIAVALENFWVTNNPAEGTRRFAELLARGDGVPARLRARALRAYGGSTIMAGDRDAGGRLYERSLAQSRRLGDDLGVAALLPRLALEASLRGDVERAALLAEEALAVSRHVGFPRGEAQALSVLADLARTAGDREQALALLRETVALCDRIGFFWWQAGALADLARISHELGRVADAERWAREAVSVTARIGDWRVVSSLELLARLAAETGRPDRAGRLWGAVEAERRRRPFRRAGRGADEMLDELPAGEPAFERARAEGRELTLDEAVEYAVAED